MNFKNLSENLIYIIVAFIIGGVVGFTASIKSNKQTIELLRPTIVEAIKKETTAIHNKIDVKIDKVKKSDSLNINVNQTPNSKILQSKKSDCAKEGEIIMKIENLTRRQKRRLGI